MFPLIFFAVLAYLIGGLPAAYLAGRMLKGIDIREYGSGNAGATNVMRTVGKAAGITVFVLDAGKGFIAVYALPLLAERLGWMAAVDRNGMFFVILLASCAIAGHIWPAFLQFKGGKGVATTFGAMLAMEPVLVLACLGIWVLVLLIWKYVSLASITASCFLPLLAVFTGRDLSFTIFCGVLCVVSVLAHRSNIRRLIKGTEKRVVKGKNS